MTKCKMEGCDLYASFNFGTEIKPEFCLKHKEPTMINVNNQRCQEPSCDIVPTYNYDGESAAFCSTHAKQDMIDVVNKRCVYPDCDIHPSYNYENELSALYCNKHKLPNMIDVAHKKCEEPNCPTRASFNVPNTTTPRYCFLHKKPDMINVTDAKCQEPNCTIRPSYNVKGQKRPLYCSIHKSKDMIDVVNTLCNDPTCFKRPTYNFPGEKTPVSCKEHKLPKMVDVINILCEKCEKRASFNYYTETRPKYCFDHKLEGMYNIIGPTSRCIFPKCMEKRIYGIVKPYFCEIHKDPTMINVIQENKCVNCEKEYDFIYKDNKKYCSDHYPDKKEMKTMKKQCKYCDIEFDSDFVCKECKLISNKKEWSIIRYLRKVIKTPFEHNSSKMLQGCSKRRPDVFFDLDTHVIIVEIDEHQHRTYENSCECARINEIVNGIGGRPIIFIRYNPDTTKHNGEKVEIKLQDKLDLLVDTIKKELTTEYNTFIVKLIQLFYDNNETIYQRYKEEDITDIVAV